MSRICLSNCANDLHDTRVPVRANYVNLYKWPESDAEFVKTAGKRAPTNMKGSESDGSDQGLKQHLQSRPRVVDGVSCRQIYLRSYKFTKKQSVPDMTKECFGRVREKVASCGRERIKMRYRGRRRRRRKKLVIVRKVKEFSAAAFSAIFQRLLSCTATVDVVDHY